MPKLSELPVASAGQTQKLVSVQGTGSPYTDVQVPLDASLSTASGVLTVDAGNISTGTLAPSNGGTGMNGSAAVNGQLLIGNGGGFTLGTITAGANITVTNGAGSITIASTGGSSEWTAGTVTRLGTNLALSAGTLSASGSDEWTAGTVSALSGDFTDTAGTLALADSLVNIGTNDFVFSNGSTIEGVAAAGAVDLIFQGGATVATGEYVLETALPYPIAISDAKTWISGTSPSATGVAVQVIHAGTTTAVTGLSALSITTGTPNSPTTTSATGANTAAAGDTLQVNIGTLGGTITALGIHLDFTRTG